MRFACYCIGVSSMDAGTALGNLVSAVGIRQEEADLITQLKAGSEEAFAWLVATYHQPVYSLIARMLPAQADAADITQEVFVKVYRGISGFHGDASLRTWIYRIALHETSNQRRWWSRHKRQELAIDAPVENEEGECTCLAETLAAEDASPFEQAMRAETRQRVEA